jgi:hypothetical protein
MLATSFHDLLVLICPNRRLVYEPSDQIKKNVIIAFTETSPKKELFSDGI